MTFARALFTSVGKADMKRAFLVHNLKPFRSDQPWMNV